MNKKILVTGGAGFIGRALVKELLTNGQYNVRVLDNNYRGSTFKLRGIKNNIEIIKGDIRNPQTTKKAVKGVDSVIHLACINGTEFFYSIPEVVLDVGIKGTLNIVESCLKEGVNEFFFASSSEVYQNPPTVPTPENVRMIIPDPFNPRYSYAGVKIIGELITLNYGRKYFKRAIVFRPHNVYGPDMGFEHVIPQFVLRLKTLDKKYPKDPLKFPIQGTGKETRAFCYIDDFTRGLMKIINKGKHMEIYNIGTENEISAKKLALQTAKCFNRKIIVVPGKIQKGSTPRRCPDISKIKKLGYKPSVSINDGLKKTYEWYVNNSGPIK